MFFDRPASGERVILVHLQLSGTQKNHNPEEFEELALSAGGDPVAFITGQQSVIVAKTFVGSGKAEELRELVSQHHADIVIFNHTLSPGQERNLETLFQCRVLDRTGLILDIFAQRARTHEGKLQVELAQLQHMSTRLVRGWTHLERQKGGIGLRGPGETQLETDRRLLRARIKFIKSRLDRVRKQRNQGRRSRLKASTPTISLVGYTNAGKSTLFNATTGAGVYADDKLFATLDPTMRQINLPSVGKAVLIDTVGFISHLPHKLIEAFSATLEEASHSSLLLHVIDSADDERQKHIEQVGYVLEEIGANELPQLKVYNKIDLLEHTARIERDKENKPVAVWLSGQTGEGLALLMQAISECLGEELISGTLYFPAAIPVNLSRIRAHLYQAGAVQKEHYDDSGHHQISICIPQRDMLKILGNEKVAINELQWYGEAPNLDMAENGNNV